MASRPPLSRNCTVMPIGPSLPRDTSSRKPPRRVTAAATLWVSAFLRKVNTSKSVDFPVPFAPTMIVSAHSFPNSASRNSR